MLGELMGGNMVTGDTEVREIAPLTARSSAGRPPPKQRTALRLRAVLRQPEQYWKQPTGAGSSPFLVRKEEKYGTGSSDSEKGRRPDLKAGGAWIFDNEIDKVEGTPEDGSLVEVRDFDGYGMGTGFYNSRSKIRVRMMSRKGRSGDRPGLPAGCGAERWDYRKKTVDTSSCRIIFGEADFLPGLVDGKFSVCWMVQIAGSGLSA